jgi:hypothetical protein
LGEIILKLFKLKQVDSYSFLMFMLIKNVEKPKLPKLVWALRKQFGPETLGPTCLSDFINSALI